MNNVLRHLFATIAYRFQKNIKDVNDSFSDLKVGKGVRQPLEILHHMVMVLEYGKTMLTKKKMVKGELTNWEEQVELFHEKLGELDNLSQETEPDEAKVLKLVQGPLADVLTHIGQLALLNRIHGTPIKRENFTTADIAIGRVGIEQKFKE